MMNVKEQVLSPEIQVFLEKLESLDLEQISHKLLHSEPSQGWTQSQVERAIADYKIFLYLLYLYPNGAILPTQQIEAVWRQHVLDTDKYAQDGQWLFGYFVPYYPGTAADKASDCIELKPRSPSLSQSLPRTYWFNNARITALLV